MRTLIIFILFVLHAEIGHTQSDTLPPGSIGYRLTKAIEKSREKKYDEAIIIVDSAISIDSTNENTYALKAELLWMKKDYYNATIFFRRAMSFDKDSSYLKGAYLFLGVLYEKADLIDEAQKQYLKAINLFENNKREDDRFFENVNAMDYAVALKLSGIEKKWEGLMNEPRFSQFHELHKGKSREEVLKSYWDQYDGD